MSNPRESGGENYHATTNSTGHVARVLGNAARGGDAKLKFENAKCKMQNGRYYPTTNRTLIDRTMLSFATRTSRMGKVKPDGQ